MTDTNKEIDRLLAEISDKSQQRDKLLDDLRKSLTIKAVWPEAFHNGQSCTIKAPAMTEPKWRDFRAGRLAVKGAYIERLQDGERFELTPEQFYQLDKMRSTSK